MILAYLWLDKIEEDPKDNLGYNFFGKYLFSFDGRHLINIVENDNYIDNFYKNNNPNIIIESLTCIVGGNGAGKTTVINDIKDFSAKAFSNCLESPHLAIFVEKAKSIEEFYCIYKNPNYPDEKYKEIRLSENIIDEKFKNHFHLEKYDFFIHKYKADLAVIHYSNYINEEIDFESDNSWESYYDIQTKTLINSCSKELFDKLHYSFNPLSVYQMEEYNNFFDFFLGINSEEIQTFINESYNCPENQVSQIMRAYATIEPVNYKYVEFRKFFIEKCNEKSPIIVYLDSLENFFINKFNQTSTLLNPLIGNKSKIVFENHKWHYLHSICLLLTNAFSGILNENLSNNILQQIFGVLPINNEETVGNLLEKFNKLIDIYYSDLDRPYVNDLFKYLKNFFLLLENNLIDENQISQINSIFIRISNNNNDFKNFIDTYIKIINNHNFGRFCKFGWWRKLSSGEHAMLTLFSRLYKTIKNLKYEDKNLLILIDEGEIGFHPYWQKRYINSLIDYFELIIRLLKKENFKIQLIITTNNPILLSDIQPSDVIFMSDHKVLVKDNCEAFGSNILDLYSDNFFIQDGLIGSFSQNKIANLLNDLDKTDFKPKKEYELLISNIGDINIRNYINIRYKEKKVKKIELQRQS